MITVDAYILYGYLSFISLLLVVLIANQIRISSSISKIQGQIEGLVSRIEKLEEEVQGLRERFDERFDNLQSQINTMRENIAEIRGLMRALHDRLDQLTRHHHDEAGRVVIVPAEAPAAD